MKTVDTVGMALAGLLVGWTGSQGLAAEEDVTVGASADVSALSAYVWRGQVLNDESVVQPAATIAKGGFAINVWGNFNLTEAATGESAEFSEVDLTVSYSRPVGPVTLGGGLIEYLFPNQTLVAADGTGTGYPGTREVYLSASLSSLPVVPSLALYYDFDEADSFYALGSLAYSAKLHEALSLGLNASLGYGAADGTGTGYPSTHEAYLSASLSSLPVTPSLTLYYDFGEVDSFYALGSLAYSAKLHDALSMGLNASLGYGAADYNAFYFGVDKAAMNDANFGVSLAWTVCPSLTVTPAYQYTMLVNSDIEDGAAGLYKDKDQSIVSVKATFTF